MAALDFPTSPSNNDTYAANGLTYSYNEPKDVWTVVTSIGSSPIVTDSTAPSTPADGDLWWDTEYGKLYVYFEDVDTSQWVEINADGVGYTGSVGSGYSGSVGYAGSTGGLGYTGSQADVANTTEVDTGTNNTKAITPDSLAGSTQGTRVVQITCVDYTTDVESANGVGYFHVPATLDGMNLVDVHAEVITAGNTGITSIQIHNLTQAADMLTDVIQIDDDETASDTAANSALIDTAEDDVATNDLLRIDVDGVQSETAPQGLIVTMEFRLP